MRNSARRDVLPELNRVKVAIRCRPASTAEIVDSKNQYSGVVNIYSERLGVGKVVLSHPTSESREFQFDHAFGPEYDQGAVFEAVAEPVINDFLTGRNGTLFAYGQTGTGKTYTMGVLEFVKNENAGIIPRAISMIFAHTEKEMATRNITVKVTLSFLQLYRETIQDLLAPLAESPTAGAGNSSQRRAPTTSESNLAIREDPTRGFYVEGLQEFEVSSYAEAEVLLNVGLENRAIASTLMNTTSSRSHTILTLRLETQRRRRGDSSQVRTSNDFDSPYGRPVQSKLMLVDLAGSERVRRSVSQGARLAEAKSINSSLSALGNVIAALADISTCSKQGYSPSMTHIPYRDSKLTKLLQDSLCGSASTALIATVGPAAVDHGETLSTLQFAARCMAVTKSVIDRGERDDSGDVDYVSECYGLREEVSMLEDELAKQQRITAAQSKIYDATIRQLYSDLATSKRSAALSTVIASKEEEELEQEPFDFDKLDTLIDRLSNAAQHSTASVYTEITPRSVGTLSSPSTSHVREKKQINRHVNQNTVLDEVVNESRTESAPIEHVGSYANHRAHESASIRLMELASMQKEDAKRKRTLMPSFIRSNYNGTEHRTGTGGGAGGGTVPYPPQRMISSLKGSGSDTDSNDDDNKDLTVQSEDRHYLHREGSMRLEGDNNEEYGEFKGRDVSPLQVKKSTSVSEHIDRVGLTSNTDRAVEPRAPSLPPSSYSPNRLHRSSSSVTAGSLTLKQPPTEQYLEGRKRDDDRDVGRYQHRERLSSREVDVDRNCSEDVGSLVDRIASLSASQISSLNPAMREQVLAMQRMFAMSGDAVQPSVRRSAKPAPAAYAFVSDRARSGVREGDGDRQTHPIADSYVSMGGGRRSSARPTHWQHRYRDFNETESDYQSDQEEEYRNEGYRSHG